MHEFPAQLMEHVMYHSPAWAARMIYHYHAMCARSGGEDDISLTMADT